ncbi:MAG: ATP-binding protein [Actinomycetota bacterium]
MNPFIRLRRRLDRRLPLAVKVGIPVVLISTVVAAAFGATSIAETKARINDTYAVQATALIPLIVSQAQDEPDDPNAATAFLGQFVTLHPDVQRVRVFELSLPGSPIVWASSDRSELGLRTDPRLLPAPGEIHRQDVDLDGESTLLVLERVEIAGEPAWVGIYFSTEARAAAVDSVRRRIFVEATLVIAAELVALTLVLYFLVLRRVKRMGGAASAVARGDYSVRLREGEEPPSNDELVNVAREFDRMISAVESRTHEQAEVAERLRELDEAKNTLLHAVSHDLRSPITSILGSAMTLERSDEMGLDEEQQKELLRGLVSGARKMHRMVSDLLDLDRLDKGIVAPRRRRADIAALVRRVVEEIGPHLVGKHEVRLETEPVEIAVDAPKVERIVENLLANAAKHTPKGTGVWAKVRPHDGGALITVEDEGPGVPPKMRQSIFEPFRQVSGARGGGVGIGLSLVSSFAQLHGGRAWVTDREGGGASFNVYIPDGPEDPGDEKESEHPTARIGSDHGGRSSTG